MKKQISILVFSGVLALNLAACQTSGPAAPTETSFPVTETTVPVTETTAVTETTVPTEPAPVWDFDTAPVIDKTLLYEGEGLKITALDLRYEADRAILRFRMENSDQRDFYLCWNESSSPLLGVNGRYVPVSGDFLPIYTGESLEYSMELPYETLLDLGIRSISQISFCLTEQDFSTGILTVSTKADCPSFWETVTEEPQSLSWKVLYSSDVCAFQNKEIRHTGSALIETEQGKQLFFLDFENTSRDIRVLYPCEAALNGLHLAQYGDMITLLPGGHGQIVIDLKQWNDDNYLDVLGIDGIGTLELQLAVYTEKRESLLRPTSLKITVDESQPAFTGAGKVVYEEAPIALSYVGTFPARSQETGDLNLVLIWNNRTDGPFMCQAESLTYNDKEVPIYKNSLRLENNGLGILTITIPADSAEGIDPASGSFTLDTQERFSRSSAQLSYVLPNS